MKKLSKDEMKKVMGGLHELSPISAGDGSDGGNYKCCWTDTSNCSECVYLSGGGKCVSGATLTSC